MAFHRNSQKRIYVDNGIYFITTNTHKEYPYFDNSILCDLFVDELLLCKRLKGFDVLGYKINPQHVHLLIRAGDKFDFSNIMHFLKRNFSQNANKIMGVIQARRPTKGEDAHRRLLWDHRLCGASSAFVASFDEIVYKHKQKFIKMYGVNHRFPPFKWQKSFHFHIINNENDLFAHLYYIRDQWLKHGLQENKYCYVGALP